MVGGRVVELEARNRELAGQLKHLRAERERLDRDLHDDVQDQLVALLVRLRIRLRCRTLSGSVKRTWVAGRGTVLTISPPWRGTAARVR
jgi:hypothetical protein